MSICYSSIRYQCRFFWFPFNGIPLSSSTCVPKLSASKQEGAIKGSPAAWFLSNPNNRTWEVLCGASLARVQGPFSRTDRSSCPSLNILNWTQVAQALHWKQCSPDKGGALAKYHSKHFYQNIPKHSTNLDDYPHLQRSKSKDLLWQHGSNGIFP